MRRLIEGPVTNTRAYLETLAAHPDTRHFAVGLRKIFDAQGWSYVDLAARRTITVLHFFLEMALPYCWNARFVRPVPRRGGRATTFSGAYTVRKFSMCVRGVSREALSKVIAGQGHCTANDRSVDVSTVSFHTALLDEAKLIQRVQVPAHAAQSFEIGTSGHSINHYHLADPRFPKPALMGCWTVAGVLVDEHVLDVPWPECVEPTQQQSTAPP